MGGVNKAASTVLYSASKENSAIRGKDFLYAYPYIFTYLHTSVNLSAELFLVTSDFYCQVLFGGFQHQCVARTLFNQGLHQM